MSSAEVLRPGGRGLPVILTTLFTVGTAALGALAPGVVDCQSGPTDDSHLLCLVDQMQPLSPLAFLALPLALIAVLLLSDLRILFDGTHTPGWIRTLSTAASLAATPVLAGLAAYVATHLVVPATSLGTWRGPTDVAAALCYLAILAPAVVITLVELQILGRDRRSARRQHALATLVALGLAIATLTFSVINTPVAAKTTSELVQTPR